MVRRVPTTDVLIKRVIFVGRAVDSHSTGTEIDTSHLHRIDFFLCVVRARCKRAVICVVSRDFGVVQFTILKCEITFEIPPKKRHFFLL